MERNHEAAGCLPVSCGKELDVTLRLQGNGDGQKGEAGICQ